MAEIQNQNQASKTKKRTKGKKLSTRVDLTPMVDLGFLLITFFIFTTALAKPNAMKLVMPDDLHVTDPMQSSENKTLTLLLSKDNTLFYYEGLFTGHVVKTNYGDVRNVIAGKKKELLKTYGSDSLLVLIKVTREASFKNIVDCLDEMLINSVSSYMLLDAEEKEARATLVKE